jgi:2-C-methyl-D-erythritol 2,4-cyclodiphosphate synthase
MESPLFRKRILSVEGLALDADHSQREDRMTSPDTPRRLHVRGLAPRDPARSRAGAPQSQPATAAPPLLVGHGYDIHRLQSSGRLILAGVLVSQEIGPIAHSDGDVVFHAITDALLGAQGLGDIGDIFPNTDPRWKNADSRIFLEDAYNRARTHGYRLISLDVTLLLERPKIGPLKADMVRSLRRTFGPACVLNLKVGTNEGCDAIGQGAAVAAHAVLLLMNEA